MHLVKVTYALRTGEVISVPVGNQLTGRVINAIGEPIDGKGPLNNTKRREIFKVAPGVMSRVEVNEPLGNWNNCNWFNDSYW